MTKIKAAEIIDLEGIEELTGAKFNTVKQWRYRYPEYFRPLEPEELPPELTRFGVPKTPLFLRARVVEFMALERRPGRPKVKP